MIDLSQEEADLLIAIEKLLTDPRAVKLPDPGSKIRFELSSKDNKEQFVGSFYRGGKNINKATYNLIYQNATILLRVDTGHGIHINPDGNIIEANTPHIHIYQEGYQDSYAYKLPSSFQNSSDIIQTLFDFLKHSNVININLVKIYCQGGLFNEGAVQG